MLNGFFLSLLPFRVVLVQTPLPPPTKKEKRIKLPSCKWCFRTSITHAPCYLSPKMQQTSRWNSQRSSIAAYLFVGLFVCWFACLLVCLV
ncbi:hypothetical protein K505DRAFT_62439 [Melanomma pulvis-pyrius CBS 109.77]|uniref:LITAF domain-containing protein n=1 Tax=Melanomma pulvis-pyrius CBS 109.77 TaxID=1314802 RepID=A0A6A6X5Y9_9PLEO|nr:hypothetical protein K505DRAFT_62439 [Melanomma pulvis-pyrius CBS 109.77]